MLLATLFLVFGLVLHKELGYGLFLVPQSVEATPWSYLHTQLDLVWAGQGVTMGRQNHLSITILELSLR